MGFRENLKSQLEYSGMLVKELANRSGIKKKTLDSYLGNRGYTPSVEAAASIARALGVSVEYLLNGTDIKNNRPLATLPKDLQELVQAAEHLNARDRYVLLNLARLLNIKT